jgi:hypothetical protein
LEVLLNEHQAWLSKKIPEWDARYLQAEKALPSPVPAA